MDYLKSGLDIGIASLKHVVSISLPIIVGSVVQVGLQDERVRKIACGFSFMMSGVKSICFWKNSKSQGEESTLKTVSRLGVATIGVAGICFGVYQVATGVLNIVAPQTCENALVKAQEKLLSCPQAKRIWDSLAERSPFTAGCATPSDGMLGLSHFAEETREILVINGPTDEIVETLSYGMHAMRHPQVIGEIVQAYKEKTISYEKYTEIMTNVAQLLRIDVEILSEDCIENGFW